MRVTYFQRSPGPGHHSIEGAFETLANQMRADVSVRLHILRFTSIGLWRRLLNLLEAPWFQGDVNHITGDVHYVTFLMRRRRTVLTIHDIGTYHVLRGWRRLAFRWLWVTLPIRRSRIVTVPSQVTRDDVLALSGCRPDKVRVIPMPLAPQYVHSPRPFREDRPTILAVGTSPNKNLDRLIEAIQGITCRLEVVGVLSPEQHDRLRRLGVDYAESHGLERDQMRAKYHEADIVAFVSTSEGFGLPVIEANAVGRPVVTSNCSSLPEVAGPAACLVDPFDAVDIRRGLVEVMGDAAYRRRLVAAGLDNARRFSAETVAAQYRDVYKEIAG